MTKSERVEMEKAIQRDKRIFEKRVPDNVKKLVSEGIEYNKGALKKLAKK